MGKEEKKPSGKLSDKDRKRLRGLSSTSDMFPRNRKKKNEDVKDAANKHLKE